MKVTVALVRQQAVEIKRIAQFAHMPGRTSGSADEATLIGVQDVLEWFAEVMPKIEALCVHIDAITPGDETGEEAIARELCETWRIKIEEGW